MTLESFQHALLDPSAPIPSDWPGGTWGVLLLFLVPVGGGIPAGVLLARDRGVAWPLIMGLYLVSDVILAFVFEPMLRLLMAVMRLLPPLRAAARRVRGMLQRTTARYGTASGPLALVLVSFGVDPMTGRAAASAAGHGFFSGWTIAIAGDMLYFVVLMASTLWLNNVLGDERTTIVAMLVVMIVLPGLLRRWNERDARTDGTDA